VPTRSTDHAARSDSPWEDTRPDLPVEVLDQTLYQLIAGLHTVGEQAIPYSRLPARVRTAYAADFTCWADIADQTVAALSDRGGAGAVTVRALLRAARDAVDGEHIQVRPSTPAAATTAALDALTPQERGLLTHLVWRAPRLTRPSTAARLGMSQGSLPRALRRARARLAEVLADPAHQQVAAHAEQLGQRLGPYAAPAAVRAALQDLGLVPDSTEAGLLLHLAGPYAETDDAWLNNETLGGRERVAGAVDRVFATRPAPTAAALTAALTAAGMPADLVATYLDSRTDLRRFGDVYVQWGAHAVHHIEAVLHARRRPATIAEIRSAIGEEHIAEETIRPIVQSYPQFHRVSRTRWALQVWNLPEYRGIFTELAARIDAAGGLIPIADLVADMQAAFPDVATSSVNTNLDAPAFVKRDGLVRRRTDDDPWPTREPFNTVRGAFRRGRTEIRLAIPVDADVLRGSGRPIPAPVATALGLHPGEKRHYETAHGQTPLAWRMDSTHGPGIGSTRALATASGARLGDTLVLIFNLRAHTLDAVRIPASIGGKQRLLRLLGRQTLARTVVAASLDCRPARIEEVLTTRGEADVARITARLPDHLTPSPSQG
jgi:hypothetical protein